MNVWLELFVTFFKIGLVSFGGGYSMVPVIGYEAVSRGWMNQEQFSDIIAVAGASPGPIAANSATMIGYHVSGIGGAVVSALGITLPSLLIVIIIGVLFVKVQHFPAVKRLFVVLRPVVAALIFFSAYQLFFSNGAQSEGNWRIAVSILIFAGALIALMNRRAHPLTVIAVSGLVGVALYV